MRTAFDIRVFFGVAVLAICVFVALLGVAFGGGTIVRSFGLLAMSVIAACVVAEK